jgi:hypothetical protein
MLDRPDIWVTAGTSAELHRRIGLMENTYPAMAASRKSVLG